MKNVKILCIALLMLGGMFLATAQTKVISTYPKLGTVVSTIHKPNVVVHKKTRFYFADGVWYKARGKKYIVATAPVGVKVRRLPNARKAVVINGKRLYKYRGVLYKKTGRNFVVVTV